MALNATTLANLIKSEIQSRTNPGSTPPEPLTLDEFCTAVANAVVSHITSNAQVTVTGVTTGAGSATGTVS